MTVIAGFIAEGSPILMGDLLISGPEAPGRPLHLPTVRDFSAVFPEGSAFVPISTRQKIALVSNELLIAWAGNAFAAKTVVNELIKEGRKQPFTRERLRDYFNSLGQTEINENVAFIGFVRENNLVHLFGYNCPLFETEAFGPVYMVGSGKEDFKYFVDNLPSNSTSRGENASNVVRAICASLSVSGGLLMGELANAQSLLQYYGAGYELASFNNGRFRKLGDVMYMFWYVEVDNDGFNVSPPREAFKYEYCEDVLVIRTAHFNDPENIAALSFKDQIWMVSPIYRDITDQDVSALRVPQMNSHFLCSYFFIRRPGRPIYTFSRVDYRQDAQSLVQFREIPNGFDFGIEQRFMQEVTRSIDRQLRLLNREEQEHS